MKLLNLYGRTFNVSDNYEKPSLQYALIAAKKFQELQTQKGGAQKGAGKKEKKPEQKPKQEKKEKPKVSVPS